jgi:hypothetical protein
MSIYYILGIIAGVAFSALAISLAINGRRWYNQLFHRNKQ